MSGNFGKFYGAPANPGLSVNQAANPSVGNAAVGVGSMHMNQMLADPLEVSASAVDQLVQFELENILEELEERKI